MKPHAIVGAFLLALASCTAPTLTDTKRLDRVERGAEKLADVLEGGW